MGAVGQVVPGEAQRRPAGPDERVLLGAVGAEPLHVLVPDAGVLFAGDLVETGQFSIFPWFPPHDTDVSGLGWIEVVRSLRGLDPGIVVPGHGAVGDAGRLADVQEYLEWLRDATWARRDTTADLDTIVAEVTAEAIARHPDWSGREWIAPGVGCLCMEDPGT